MDSASPSPARPAAFDQLVEGLQRQLYRMQWTSLRPLQADAIRAFAGSSDDLLIMAETAGGKTEAAFLPVLSSICAAPKGSIRALYVGPLKALINDQFGRLEELCTHLDVPVHRWHGDVGQAAKDALVREPGGVLLITPESLESVVINRTGRLQSLFGGLRAVVVDELHAFLDDERGLHLASLLSRLRRFRAADAPPFRMLGLSATIGDIEAAKRWLRPDAPEGVRVVQDSGEGAEVRFRVHGYLKEEAEGEQERPSEAPAGAEEPPEDEEVRLMRAIAVDLVEHCRDHSNLVFANAKGDIELYADLANEVCRGDGMPESFLVHHGSLSKEVREDTEAVMKSKRPMTTICSSTLEMGIDIGSVHMVGQIGAPHAVASLKQRMGRSGRREGEPRRLRMYIRCEAAGRKVHPVDDLPLDLLQATALCELLLRKWVEPTAPAKLDLSTLSHQVMSVIAERGAVDASQLFRTLCEDGPFKSVDAAVFARVLRALGQADVIEQGPDNRLILGLEGERLRRQRDFYAVFVGKVEAQVVASGRLLGTLPLETLPKPGDHIVFAARRWQVVDVDLGRLVVSVQPARRRKRPKFIGGVGDVHHAVREEMRRLLTVQDSPVYLNAVASATLAAARELASTHALAARWIAPVNAKKCVWLTWTGTRAALTLAAMLRTSGMQVDIEEVSLVCEASAADVMVLLANIVRQPPAARDIARSVEPKQTRKLDHLLGDALLDEGIAADRLEVPGALAVIRETISE